MARIEMAITSTAVDGDYGIVDVYYNNVKVESNLQLVATPITFNHPVTPINGYCTVKVDLLNDKATDSNNDGTWDQVMDVRIISAKYAHDDENFVTMIPHNGVTFKDELGNDVYFPPAPYLSCWGRDYTRTFPTSKYIP